MAKEKATTITLTGTINWAKVFESNRDMKGYNDAYVPCNGAYTADVVLSADEYQKLSDAGSAKQGKVTDDGDYSVKLVRKHDGPFEAVSGPPVVIKSDGNPWDVTDDGLIPNGSEVEVTCTVYPTKYNVRGTRLDKVKIVKTNGTYVQEVGDEPPF